MVKVNFYTKLIRLFFSVLVSSQLILSLGCGLSLLPSSPLGAPPERPSSVEFKTSYGRYLGLVAVTADLGVETVGRYLDLESSLSRGLNPASALQALGESLPDDLHSLKRVRISTQPRTLGEPEEVTLGGELEELQTEFDGLLTELLPDPTLAKSLPSVEIGDEGIRLSDDEVVPLKSPQGIAMIEVMNAIASGENPEDVVTQIQSDAASLGGELDEDSRALYRTGQWTWDNRTVNYRWKRGDETTVFSSMDSGGGALIRGEMNEQHKQAMREAMTTWTTETSGRIKFRELGNDGWTSFLLGIGILHCVNFADGPADAAVYGSAPVGGFGGYLQIRRGLDDPLTLQRTARHELGHVIGLQHEHQRADRNDWIIVMETGYGYDKMPEYVERLHWRSVTFRTWWGWKFKISYPWYGRERNTVLQGPFDLHSIMLYGGFEMKTPYFDTLENQFLDFTRHNTDLSASDIAGVLRMYP